MTPRTLLLSCAAVALTACDLILDAIDDDAPEGRGVVLNEVAPLEGGANDWLELCVPSGKAVSLGGWTLTASVGGATTTLATLPEETASGRVLVGPASMAPLVALSLDVPDTSENIVLELLDGEGEHIDAMTVALNGIETRLVVARKCDCVSAGSDVADVMTLGYAQATPGASGPGGSCSAPPDGAAPDGGTPSGDGGAGDQGGSESGLGSEAGPADVSAGDAPPATGVCHTYWPIAAAGKTWSYKLTSGQTGTQVYTTQGGGAGMYDVQVDTSIGSTTLVDEITLSCVDDELADALRHTQATTAGVTSDTVTTFDPPLRVLAKNPAVGQSFQQDFAGSSKATYPGVGEVVVPLTGTQTVTVEAAEQVQVPAGTYQTLRVKQVVTTLGQTDEHLHWYAKGVGLVKSFGPPSNGGAAITWELVSVK